MKLYVKDKNLCYPEFKEDVIEYHLEKDDIFYAIFEDTAKNSYEEVLITEQDENGNDVEFVQKNLIVTKDNAELAYSFIRAHYYKNYADALFFKVGRGELDRAIWEDKINEIKAKFKTPNIL